MTNLIEQKQQPYTPSRIVGRGVTGTEYEIDISEESLYLPEYDLLTIILADHSTDGNIIWATDNYAEYGEGYSFADEITPEKITGDMNLLIQPRVAKDKALAARRTKDKAEVFTPSWVCHQMNDCVDDAWFGIDDNATTPKNFINVADEEEISQKTEHMFATGEQQEKIDFSNAMDSDGRPRTWKDYVLEDRLEITCGEAPYLASRYDAATGEPIAVPDRYGILDRKLRIVSENIDDPDEWQQWAERACQHTYGYEWQGDSILLARENLLATVRDHYKYRFSDTEELPKDFMLRIAEIISWNIWQMDGLKFVIPGSCSNIADLPSAPMEDVSEFTDTLFILYEPDNPSESSEFESENKVAESCPGCSKGNKKDHNGIYALVMDWEEEKPICFVDLLP